MPAHTNLALPQAFLEDEAHHFLHIGVQNSVVRVHTLLVYMVIKTLILGLLEIVRLTIDLIRQCEGCRVGVTYEWNMCMPPWLVVVLDGHLQNQ